MYVTFDTQTFRSIVEPERQLRHPALADVERVHHAILLKSIRPLASEGMFALEEIVRADRASYLAKRKLELKTGDEAVAVNQISFSVTIGPDHTTHPGLSVESKRRFAAAERLGFQYLNIPRFGLVRPSEFLGNRVYFNCGDDFHHFTAYAERFGKVAEELESRGVGFSIAYRIGLRAQRRCGRRASWCELLTDPRYFNESERHELGAAVSEWCDGDLVAAHVAHGLTFICTEDRGGKKQRQSVFNAANREWIAREFGVQFVSLVELADSLPR